MKNEYGKNYYVVKADQVEKHFDDNGFSRTELLPGVYDGGIRSYKCFLKAGCKVSPELYKDKGVVILFGQGKGVRAVWQAPLSPLDMGMCTTAS